MAHAHLIPPRRARTRPSAVIFAEVLAQRKSEIESVPLATGETSVTRLQGDALATPDQVSRQIRCTSRSKTAKSVVGVQCKQRIAVDSLRSRVQKPKNACVRATRNESHQQ
jgi:hypothetical protein